jgi:hypothetical protein
MSNSKVAVLQTSPQTVLADYHRLMNLAGYQGVVAKDADISRGIFSSPEVRPHPGSLRGWFGPWREMATILI